MGKNFVQLIPKAVNKNLGFPVLQNFTEWKTPVVISRFRLFVLKISKLLKGNHRSGADKFYGILHIFHVTIYCINVKYIKVII